MRFLHNLEINNLKKPSAKCWAFWLEALAKFIENQFPARTDVITFTTVESKISLPGGFLIGFMLRGTIGVKVFILTHEFLLLSLTLTNLQGKFKK